MSHAWGKVDCWRLNLKSKEILLAFSSFPSPFLALVLCVVHSFGSRMVAGMDGGLRKSNRYAFLCSQVFESLYVSSMGTGCHLISEQCMGVSPPM
jgi:hypothetical protein